jgi:Protein of unknown function (DUF2752)
VIGGTAAIDARELRTTGAAMLGAAFVLPALLPGHAGLPCPLRTLTGVPCPLCGMTTSVEDTVHAHLGRALAANPGGIAAVAGAAALLVLRPAHVVVSRAAVVATLAAMWVFELHRFGFL